MAIRYSFTKAMSPAKKESAYLHIPTYVAGIVFHLGAFLSFTLFFVAWFYTPGSGIISLMISGFLLISVICGTGILVKRMFKKTLREISNIDDYISNILVTFLQLVSALWLLNPGLLSWYFLALSLVLLYFPLGKLKHAFYFFAARYQLGLFYGRRGVWPPKQIGGI